MGRKDSKKKDKDKKSSSEKTVKGVLDITRSGMGFVTSPELDVDVLVRPGDFNTALHGDTVRVRVNRFAEGKKRMQGIITELVQRKRTEFIGKLEMNKGFAFFVASMDRPMPNIYIPEANFNGAKDNDRVVVKLIEWEKSGKRPLGEVVSVLNEEEPNDAAMKEILLENGFAIEFPDDVMEEAARIPDTISEAEIKKQEGYPKYINLHHRSR